MMSAPPADIEIRCPACSRYLGTVDGTRLRCAPCCCGVQTTVEIVGKRARRLVALGDEAIEVKTTR